MNERALHLLSLAKKGGNLAAGEEDVGAACRKGKARLMICASDIGDRALRRARGWSESCQTPIIRPNVDKNALGAALGRPVCALVGVTDRKLAAAFVRALEESERYDGLLAQLERRPGRHHVGDNLEVAE